MSTVLKDLSRRFLNPTTATTERPSRLWQTADYDAAVHPPVDLLRLLALAETFRTIIPLSLEVKARGPVVL